MCRTSNLWGKGTEEMSTRLEQSAADLNVKAQNHTILLRRALQEYNEATRNTPGIDKKLQVKEREIERAVAHLARIHKALKRVRKKMRVSK